MSGHDNGGSENFLKRIIEEEFTRRGVHSRNARDNGDNDDMLSPRLLLKNVPYVSIYKRQARSPFLYRHFQDAAIRIHYACQEGNGSVDEKFPFMFLNARDAMPENEIWFVIDGDGAKEEGVEWFKEVAAATDTKTIRIMDLFEFRRAVKDLVTGARDIRDAAE
jgi:hypothetical protein